jgi:hypothetical protein
MCRWCSLALLLLLAASPLAQLRCTAACTPTATAAVHEACHDEPSMPDEATASAPGHDCAAHATAVSTAAPARVAFQPIDRVAVLQLDMAWRERAAGERVVPPPSGGPPHVFLVPQRI